MTLGYEIQGLTSCLSFTQSRLSLKEHECITFLFLVFSSSLLVVSFAYARKEALFFLFATTEFPLLVVYILQHSNPLFPPYISYPESVTPDPGIACIFCIILSLLDRFCPVLPCYLFLSNISIILAFISRTIGIDSFLSCTFCWSVLSWYNWSFVGMFYNFS